VNEAEREGTDYIVNSYRHRVMVNVCCVQNAEPTASVCVRPAVREASPRVPQCTGSCHLCRTGLYNVQVVVVVVVVAVVVAVVVVCAVGYNHRCNKRSDKNKKIFKKRGKK